MTSTKRRNRLRAFFARVGRKIKYRNYKPLESHVKLKSSNLYSAAYDKKNKVMEVQFHANKGDRPLYRYENAPESAYKKLLKAKSKGKVFHTEIRPKLKKYTRIK